MLSGVFRFILPELSSHFVLHDLLRSFCLERPLFFLAGSALGSSCCAPLFEGSYLRTSGVLFLA